MTVGGGAEVGGACMEMEHDLQHPAQNSPARTSSTSPGLSTLITLGNTQQRAETRRAATANVRLESWWWWWWWWWGHMDPHSAHKDIVTMVRDSCTHGSMQPAPAHNLQTFIQSSLLCYLLPSPSPPRPGLSGRQIPRTCHTTFQVELETNLRKI